ncbi:RNA polymerase sigma factor SigF, partial [Streptomyces sp. SID89]|nr:RNA polymerase sigma factor SigF [Streptomyces sp. SID89]
MSASTAPPQEEAPAEAAHPGPAPAPTAAPAPAETEKPEQPGQPGQPERPEQPEKPEKRRGADTRALTQVLFTQLKELEPGTSEHARVRGALIEANLPLVRYAAGRFRSRNEPMEDVVQVGTIGLINAIDRFDPDRGVQFPTFAMPTVVG